jgi:hypothetical protein
VGAAAAAGACVGALASLPGSWQVGTLNLLAGLLR